MANPSDSEVRLYDCTPFVCVSVRLINGTTCNRKLARYCWQIFTWNIGDILSSICYL